MLPLKVFPPTDAGAVPPPELSVVVFPLVLSPPPPPPPPQPVKVMATAMTSANELIFLFMVLDFLLFLAHKNGGFFLSQPAGKGRAFDAIGVVGQLSIAGHQPKEIGDAGDVLGNVLLVGQQGSVAVLLICCTCSRPVVALNGRGDTHQNVRS